MSALEPVGIGREVLYEVVDGQIAIIRLHRPERRNAISRDVAQAIDFLIRKIEADPALRVVVLTSSSNGFFCAGADLSVIAAGRKNDLATPDGGFAGLIDARRAKPWIAAVTGPVLADGFELCLACDMIVATDSAVFGLPEVKRGLFAASGGVHRLGRAIPRNIAIEMVATGDPINAERAHALGLVNRLATSEGLLDEALALARTIAANAPMSVKESLHIARVANEESDLQLRKRSKVAERIIFSSKDAIEGPIAFLEKRAPIWLGE